MGGRKDGGRAVKRAEAKRAEGPREQNEVRRSPARPPEPSEEKRQADEELVALHVFVDEGRVLGGIR